MQLFKHNNDAYRAALAMMSSTGKAAVVHPTGTGKSFIGMKLCEDHPSKTVCWISPSEYIFRTQIENWRSAGGGELDNIRFFTYAKLSIMSDDEIARICPDYIVLDEFHRAGAECWGEGVQTLLSFFPKAPILGLTATAIRYLDHQRNMADELFDGNVASEMTLGEAIVRGILNPPKYVLAVYSLHDNLIKIEERVKRQRKNTCATSAKSILRPCARRLKKRTG